MDAYVLYIIVYFGIWLTVTPFGKPPTMCTNVKLVNNGGCKAYRLVINYVIVKVSLVNIYLFLINTS
jgi:hypothetical protein